MADETPKNPQWNQPQWNYGQFQEWQPQVTGAGLASGAGSVSCAVHVVRSAAGAIAGASASAAAALRRRHSQTASAGASTSIGSAVRRRLAPATTAGVSSSASAFIWRKVIVMAPMGAGLVSAAVERTIRYAHSLAGTSHAEATLSRLELPAPLQGGMRVGRWARPTTGTRLRIRSWPAAV